MDTTKEIGRRIALARNARGWSQTELARQTGCMGSSRISNYEQGTRRPSIEDAKLLARLLGVSPGWLLTLDEESNLAPRERVLLDRFRETDGRGQETVLRVAEAQPAYQAETEPDQKAS